MSQEGNRVAIERKMERNKEFRTKEGIDVGKKNGKKKKNWPWKKRDIMIYKREGNIEK